MPGHCSMILAALGETEIKSPKFGILGSQSPLLTPSSALALSLPPEQQRCCNPAADLKLYPRIKKKKKIIKKSPFFPPRLRMLEQICSPCVAAEPALLTVGPSFPWLAGCFPEDAGCWLHPGEAGDAPLKTPSPAVTPSLALGDKNLQVLGMFETSNGANRGWSRAGMEGEALRRRLAVWRGMGMSNRKETAEFFHLWGRIAPTAPSPQSVVLRYEHFCSQEKV